LKDEKVMFGIQI